MNLAGTARAMRNDSQSVERDIKMKKYYLTCAPRESNPALQRFDSFDEALQVAEKEMKAGKSQLGSALESSTERFVVEIVAVVKKAEAPIVVTRFR